MFASEPTAHKLLRAAVAFAFLYPAIAGFITPTDWIGFVPRWVGNIIAPQVFLAAFGILEILIALGVLLMRTPTLPSYAAAGILALIIIFNLGAFDVLFRDIPILLAALALGLFSHKAVTP